jgi:hypothetical protein
MGSWWHQHPGCGPIQVMFTSQAMTTCPRHCIYRTASIFLSGWNVDCIAAAAAAAVRSHPTQALRAVKGILNKLTPEKYERLLAQLLEVVTTADLLKQTISLVFENAVAQPTFCAM